MTGLTEEQEAFCHHYANASHGADAYAASYPHTASRSSRWRSERARRLLRSPRILTRIADLRGEDHSKWLAKARARFVASPDQPPTLAELERLALMAFDDTKPDIVRLAALRCLDTGLKALCPATSTVRLEILFATNAAEASSNDAPR